MRALPLAMAHFAFIPFFPSFPSFSFLSLCCCHWMFSGCNSRKGKRKCLHCMLQRSSTSWCCTTTIGAIVARMTLVGIVVAIVAQKGRGRQWDNQLSLPLPFAIEAFQTFQVQGRFGKFGRFKRFKGGSKQESWRVQGLGFNLDPHFYFLT